MPSQKSNINEKYIELQILNQQIKQLQQHILSLESQIAELEILENSLEELKKVKEGTEILVPMGSGIFAKAKLQDSKKLIVNVGSNTMVKKDVEEAKRLVNEQTKQMKQLVEDIANELDKAAARIEGTQIEIQQIRESGKKHSNH